MTDLNNIVPIFRREEAYCQHCGCDLSDSENWTTDGEHDVEMCGYKKFIELTLSRFERAAKIGLVKGHWKLAQRYTREESREADDLIRRMIELGLDMKRRGANDPGTRLAEWDGDDWKEERDRWYEGFDR